MGYIKLGVCVASGSERRGRGGNVSTIGDIESFLYSGEEDYHGTHRADIHWTPEMFALEARYHGAWPESGRATPLDDHEAGYLAQALAKYGPRCLCGRCVDRRLKSTVEGVAS